MNARANIIFFTSLLCTLTISRLIFYVAWEIEPNPQHLLLNWQHLSIEDLESDMFQSLLKLHSQPPLWNAVIGIFSKTCSAESNCVVRSIHLAHIAITALVAFAIFRITTETADSAGLGLAASLLYTVTPAVIYYESFIFYPHLTSGLLAVFCLLILTYFKTAKTHALFGAFISLALLSLTWSLFHPLFIAIIIFSVLYTRSSWGIKFVSIAVITIMISISPSIKNQIIFGFFGSGSWLGLNLSQVAPNPTDTCNFRAFIERNELTGVHPGTAFNDPRIVNYSSNCLKSSLESIASDPVTYVTNRARQLATSLSRWPSDDRFPPINWNRFPHLPHFGSLFAPNGQLQYRNLAYRVTTLALNLVAIAAIAVLAINSRRAHIRSFFTVALVIITFFLAISHAVNGWEQHRMRYTVDFILWSMYFLIIYSIVWRRRFTTSNSA